MQNLTIEYIPVEQLREYSRNAKQHPAEQVQQIANSIRQFGMNDPIAIDENDTIIEGHGRLMAIRQLIAEGAYQSDSVPVIRLSHLSDQQRRAYILAHNKLTMNTGFDLDILQSELDDIFNLDMNDFGFDLSGMNEWFSSGDKGTPREDDGEYSEFVEKFKERHTTDDCYTPPPVYAAVAKWVSNEYGLKESQFVRPFYPGGDYQNEKYGANAVVVDNPPFSILSEIIKWYGDHGIPFFLFAPGLTPYNSASSCVATITVGVSIIYENGAIVPTSFITNLEPPDVLTRTAPDLYEAVNLAVREYRSEQVRELPKYTYPCNVLSAAAMNYICKNGISLTIKRADASQRISCLDSQKEFGKGIFGGGYLVSEKAAAEKAAAEKAAAEKAAVTVWELSDRERAIIAALG